MESLIGEKIAHLRKSKKMSQLELAKRAKLSNVAISEIESGKKTPKMITIAKIASAFGMDLTELLNYEMQNSSTVQENVEGVQAEHENNVDYTYREEKELLEWLRDPESIPYVRFAFRFAKEKIPAKMLENIEFISKFTI